MGLLASVHSRRHAQVTSGRDVPPILCFLQAPTFGRPPPLAFSMSETLSKASHATLTPTPLSLSIVADQALWRAAPTRSQLGGVPAQKATVLRRDWAMGAADGAVTPDPLDDPLDRMGRGTFIQGRKSKLSGLYFVEAWSALPDLDRVSERLWWTPQPRTVVMNEDLVGVESVGRLVAFGATPAALVQSLDARRLKGIDEWSIEYEFLSKIEGVDRKSFSSRMLLCAVSQRLPGVPVLDPAKIATTRLSLVEVETGFYLLALLGAAAAHHPAAEEDAWKGRPYQYSGALRLDLASTMLSILTRNRLAKCRRDTGSGAARSLRLLDVCCGSGTFLYAGSRRGMDVTGFDINPQCVAGTLENLAHMEAHCAVPVSVRQQDSSLPFGLGTPVDVVVANFPFGESIIEYWGEQERILRQIVSNCPRAEVGFVTKSGIPKAQLEALGFHCISETVLILKEGKTTGRQDPVSCAVQFAAVP